MLVQCGARRIRSPPVSLAERLPLARHLACEPVIDSARSRLGQDGACRAFGMFFLHAGAVLLGGRTVSAAQDGGCRKGPVAMSLADCGAGCALPFPGGCPGTGDQAARGNNILHPGAAGELVDVVEQHEAEHRAATGHGWQHIQGGGVRVFGGWDDGAFHGAQQRVLGGEERQIACDTFVHRGIGTAFGNALTVGVGGDL
jgi:hypothetical protein